MSNTYKSSLAIARDTIDFFNYLIEQYGEVKFIKYKDEFKEYDRFKYNDFIYFCFTKSVRSLYATIDLADKYYREDSLIILRTVYENYLYIVHVLNNPYKIQEYVEQVVGLTFGKYRYKTNENGRKNYNLVIDTDSKEYRHGTSNATRAKYSINKLDIKLHKFIYKYLSEHTHPNMMASGNYRSKDNKQYLTEPYQVYLEVPFLILYMAYILADSIYYYHTKNSKWNKELIGSELMVEFQSVIERLKITLIKFLGECNLEEEFKEMLIKRIDKIS